MVGHDLGCRRVELRIPGEAGVEDLFDGEAESAVSGEEFTEGEFPFRHVHHLPFGHEKSRSVEAWGFGLLVQRIQDRSGTVVNPHLPQKAMTRSSGTSSSSSGSMSSRFSSGFWHPQHMAVTPGRLRWSSS